MIEDHDPKGPSEPEPRLVPVVPDRATRPSAISVLRRSQPIRVAIVAVLMLVLAVPIAMAVGRRNEPAPPFAAGASAAPQASANGDEDQDKAGAKNGQKPKGRADGLGHGNGRGGLGAPGLGGAGAAGNAGKAKGGAAHGPITITAINGSDISLATDNGWTRTISVTSATTVTKGGQTVSVNELAVGDEVRFRETRNPDGTYTITALVVPGPTVGGEVSAIAGDTITVKKKDGSNREIKVTSSTVYKLGPNSGAKSDVKVGSRVAAEGTASGDAFTATTVHIALAHLGGVVTAKTADSITVERPGGTNVVIHVSSTTTYKVKGHEAASLDDIAVGSRVQAHGTANTDGSLDAVTVHGQGAKSAKPDKPAKEHAAKP